MPTEVGDFKLHAYEQITTKQIHLALVKGTWKKNEPVLTRVHSSCFTGDILSSLRCDCGMQLKKAMKMVEENGSGIILYMNQEGRGIGLINKLKAYKLQENGKDTVEANEDLGFKSDYRDYGVGAQILRDLGVEKIKLLSNNPKKEQDCQVMDLKLLRQYQFKYVPILTMSFYLKTKRDKMGHTLSNLDD